MGRLATIFWLLVAAYFTYDMVHTAIATGSIIAQTKQ